MSHDNLYGRTPLRQSDPFLSACRKCRPHPDRKSRSQASRLRQSPPPLSACRSGGPGLGNHPSSSCKYYIFIVRRSGRRGGGQRVDLLGRHLKLIMIFVKEETRTLYAREKHLPSHPLTRQQGHGGMFFQLHCSSGVAEFSYTHMRIYPVFDTHSTAVLFRGKQAHSLVMFFFFKKVFTNQKY